jgi:hypothetical protein
MQRDDSRYTLGFLTDLFQLMERHGFRQSFAPPDVANTMVHAFRMAEAFEGRDPSADLRDVESSLQLQTGGDKCAG